MQLSREFQSRLWHGAALKASPWISALALALGAGVARLLIFFAPATGSDLQKAKELGIVSISILTGHSKSVESIAYTLALVGSIVTSLAIWCAWAVRAGRTGGPVSPPVNRTTPRTSWIEFGIVTLIAFCLFARVWNGRAATFSAWSTLTEEGEMMAWVDTVLRGGALSRDIFCLYGPLSTWSVVGLFRLFHPSLGLWRSWIFGLNAPALIATYFLLRGTTRTRWAAAAGTIAIAILCTPPIPAMSWSLSRVGFGLATFAAFTRALDRGKVKWSITTGALLAGTILYSQEVGIACTCSIAVALLLRGREVVRTMEWVALGAAAVFLPAIAYLIGTHSFSATIENLFLFPRVRMLGFAAFPFPRFSLNAESLQAYYIPAVLVVSAFWTGTKLLRGIRDAGVLTEFGIFIFGALLFNAAFSRPDETHLTFVAAPALVLLTGLFENACFKLRMPSFRIAATAGLVLGTATLAPWIPAAKTNLLSLFERPAGTKLGLPRGGYALLPDDFAQNLTLITNTIQSRTAPNEPFWAFPNEALLYFLADRPEPTHFPQALLAVTRAQREQLVADLVRTKPRWAVVYLDAPEVDGIPYTAAIPEVIAYLNANYEPDSDVGAFALMRRKN